MRITGDSLHNREASISLAVIPKAYRGSEVVASSEKKIAQHGAIRAA
jgi:hypothetical protein